MLFAVKIGQYKDLILFGFPSPEVFGSAVAVLTFKEEFQDLLNDTVVNYTRYFISLHTRSMMQKLWCSS